MFDFASVDHIDGIKINNFYLNLEITTASGNTSRSGLKGKSHNLGYSIPLLRHLDEKVRGRGFPIISARSVTAYRVFYDIMFSMAEVQQRFPSVTTKKRLKKFMREKKVFQGELKLYSAPFLWDYQSDEKRFHTGVVYPPNPNVQFQNQQRGKPGL